MMSEDADTPRAAYFDTNLIREGGWPEPSARLLEIIAKAQRVGVVPCLVALVRDELIEGLMRDLKAERTSLVKYGQKFARRTLGLVKVPALAPLPAEAELRAHIVKETEKLLGGFRAVPTTQQPTAYFSKLAISRGGAFVDGGKGFNDTVILVSVIEDILGRFRHWILATARTGSGSGQSIISRLDASERLPEAAIDAPLTEKLRKAAS